ncbi:hypothetical protein FPV67DRAFT_1649750 [Lyophyllum atratum]|nr:hypothetical protein FPV67DRAFT_1649750 [Lyophyllum atratum]
MHQTPWAKKPASSSLTSDRLRPKPVQTPIRAKNSRTPEPAPPQTIPQIPPEGAFAKVFIVSSSLQTTLITYTARTHPLSPYVPICTACALPLCNLAAPAHPCPSCSQPLLTPTRRISLIARIEGEIAETELKEQLARERAVQERRAAAGAFPTLSSSGTSAFPNPSHSQSPSPKPQAPPQPQQKTHKVLSLNSKTKKAVLTTTTTTPARKSATSTPAASRPSSPQPTREPRPGLDNGKGKVKAKPGSERPWQNLSGGGGAYVPPVRVTADVEAGGDGKAGTGKRRRGRGKGKGKEGGGGEGKENVGVGQSGGGEASGS